MQTQDRPTVGGLDFVLPFALPVISDKTEFPEAKRFQLSLGTRELDWEGDFPFLQVESKPSLE
jgi:hypothetical protein